MSAYESFDCNILFRAQHVPGLQNSQADHISRFQVESFKKRIPNNSTNEPSAGELVTHLRDLLDSALAPDTKKSYQRAWGTLQQFYERLYGSTTPQLPLSSFHLALFISYLSARKLAPSTITSYLSAIGYVHKIKGYSDATKSFLIHKLLTF